MDHVLMSVCISILDRQRRSFLSKSLENYGALASFPLLILNISRHNGKNQEHLASRLKTDKAGITRAINRLEREGYITREQDAADKRAFKVFLTPKAEELIPKIQAALREWEESITAGIPAEELPKLIGYIERMAGNATRLTD